ncbi:hypothetical protein RQP46_007132 [Phenoliferia psychrophenolica]
MQVAQLDAVLAFYSAVETVDTPKALILYELRPATVGGFGKPEGRTKPEILPFLQQLPALVKHFGFQPPDFVVQGVDSVALHLKAEGEAADGSPWTNEYSIFVRFVPGTLRMVHIVEMVDSAFALAAVQRAGVSV